MCKNTHGYFGVNFLKRHLKRNRGVYNLSKYNRGYIFFWW